MKRIALVLGIVAMAGCSKGEEKPAAAPAAAPAADTSHPMMSDTSHMMMDTSKKMAAPATPEKKK